MKLNRNAKKPVIVTLFLFLLLLAVGSFLYGHLKNTKKEGALSSGQTSGKTTGSDSENTDTDTSKSGDSLTAAMDFTVQDANGNAVSLSDLFGKPIVLNFWNSNCPPCRQEMPDFEEVSKSNPDIRFVMVDTVGMNGETLESGTSYISENGFTFPVYYDINQEAITAYGIRAFPTTFLINSQGKIVTYGEGMIDKNTLVRALEQIK